MNKEDLRKFICDAVISDGKFNIQRLRESWLYPRGHTDVLAYVVKNNLVTPEDFYNHITGDFGICECTASKRFVSYSKGYKQYCERCSRTKNNGMRSDGNIDLSVDEVLEYVRNKNGKLSTPKLNKLSNNTINSIKLANPKITGSISEMLYCISNNLTEPPKCKHCGKNSTAFISAVKGYNDCCSVSCAMSFNRHDRKKKQKKNFYKNYVEKYKSDKEYDITLFSEDEYLNGNDCKIKFKHNCGHVYDVDLSYQGHTKCPKCYPIRSKVQYEIFEWLNAHKSCLFNDRRIIAPFELDIVCSNFAIEYDSLMFHSYGKSSVNYFNNTVENKNIHLRKTELCEKNGLQLFRIFSNEWNSKQDIWKSVINSKLGNTTRLYARKCVIKNVPNREYKDFCENNHLQGYGVASVRLGLYHESELVSVMSFGKSRYDKNVQYELIRFCSKLNTTVVGGASKLLNHFELNYSPTSIISYANRRWSQGDLYDKLGFEFIKNTNPNYFYFKGDLGELQSRERFQKHKLKDILESFDENLTETENMYNNGYRKIYDCGNKVYIKKY